MDVTDQIWKDDSLNAPQTSLENKFGIKIIGYWPRKKSSNLQMLQMKLTSSYVPFSHPHFSASHHEEKKMTNHPSPRWPTNTRRSGKNASIIGNDKTFNIGFCFVSATTYKSKTVKNWERKPHPNDAALWQQLWNTIDLPLSTQIRIRRWWFLLNRLMKKEPWQ